MAQSIIFLYTCKTELLRALYKYAPIFYSITPVAIYTGWIYMTRLHYDFDWLSNMNIYSTTNNHVIYNMSVQHHLALQSSTVLVYTEL